MTSFLIGFLFFPTVFLIAYWAGFISIVQLSDDIVRVTLKEKNNHEHDASLVRPSREAADGVRRRGHHGPPRIDGARPV